MAMWGTKMAEAKKKKAELKEVCKELRELLPAKISDKGHIGLLWGEPAITSQGFTFNPRMFNPGLSIKNNKALLNMLPI